MGLSLTVWGLTLAFGVRIHSGRGLWCPCWLAEGSLFTWHHCGIGSTVQAQNLRQIPLARTRPSAQGTATSSAKLSLARSC